MGATDGQKNCCDDHIPDNAKDVEGHASRVHDFTHHNAEVDRETVFVLEGAGRVVAVHGHEGHSQDAHQTYGAHFEYGLGMEAYAPNEVLTAEQPGCALIGVNRQGDPTDTDDDLHHAREDRGFGHDADDIVHLMPCVRHQKGQTKGQGQHMQKCGKDGLFVWVGLHPQGLGQKVPRPARQFLGLLNLSPPWFLIKTNVQIWWGTAPLVP